MEIKNSITGSNNIILENEIETDFIIKSYKKQLDLDVSAYFKGLKSIQLYKCLDTGYKFYYPFNIAGKDSLYQELEKFSWYYMDWKWEYDEAIKQIKNNEKVLEIGCGRGNFLKKIIEKNNVEAVGLELNKNAVLSGRKNNINIINQTIEEYSKKNKEKFDVVYSFQVLEHMYSPAQFIQSSLDTLKKNGKLIISVPNNDSIIFKTHINSLNLPPHHMGLWNINSLIKLQKNFQMTIEDIFIEPLQSYHSGYASQILEKSYEQKIAEKIKINNKLVKTISKKFALLSSRALSEYINGHSIIAIYKKYDK